MQHLNQSSNQNQAFYVASSRPSPRQVRANDIFSLQRSSRQYNVPRHAVDENSEIDQIFEGMGCNARWKKKLSMTYFAMFHYGKWLSNVQVKVGWIFWNGLEEYHLYDRKFFVTAHLDIHREPHGGCKKYSDRPKQFIGISTYIRYCLSESHWYNKYTDSS